MPGRQGVGLGVAKFLTSYTPQRWHTSHNTAYDGTDLSSYLIMQHDSRSEQRVARSLGWRMQPCGVTLRTGLTWLRSAVQVAGSRYCAPLMPPHALRKLPDCASLRLGGAGEWSEDTCGGGTHTRMPGTGYWKMSGAWVPWILRRGPQTVRAATKSTLMGFGS